jgi:hypothetical protein
LQLSGDGVLFVSFRDELLEAPFWRIVPPYIMVMSVKAREDGGPRRATQGVADEGFVEGGALFDQLGAYRGHQRSRCGVKIVGEDEDYVGPAGGFP